MAVLDNSIGQYSFTSLQGTPIPPQERAIIDDRQGVDGAETILVGKKGEPFSLIATVDCNDYQTANQDFITQQNAVTQDAFPLTQGGVKSDDLGYRVRVMKVTLAQPIVKIVSAMGNTKSTNKGAMLVTRWDLISIPYRPPT
jgi:hypothetical protein